MDHFFEIHLCQDPEFKSQVLIDTLYAKLHKALVTLHSQQIGVSFPAHTNKHLGNVMRLHGTKPELTQLHQSAWLGSMVDLLEVCGLSSIPATDQHRVVRRVQVQSSPERVKRRLVKRMMMREGIAEDQAVARVEVKPAELLQVPFVTLQSSSTRQHFRLFISHEQVQQNPVVGTFSAYALSSSATVPWF